VCRRFNGRTLAGFAVEELQADEIRTFTGSKSRPTWIFAAIEVWSRLWPSTSFTESGDAAIETRSALALVRDVADRIDFAQFV